MSSSIKVSEYPWEGPWSCDKGLMSRQKTGSESLNLYQRDMEMAVCGCCLGEELWTSAKNWLNPPSLVTVSQFDASAFDIVYHLAEERSQACKMENDQAFFVEFEENFLQRHKGI